MPYKPVTTIEVICWGHPVGALVFDPRYDAYAFEYYEEFRRSGWELSPLLAPLDTQGAMAFPNLSRETYYGLPAFIADSLPDSFGNLLIDRWMAANGVLSQQITSLDRLAYMGKRAMGALEFRPALREDAAAPTALEMNTLVEEARRALLIDLQRDAQNPRIELSAQADTDDKAAQSELQQLIAIGTSAGGTRAKAVVGYNKQTDDFVSGQFSLPAGYEHWIIKFDLSDTGTDAGSAGHQQAYGRIEYAYYLMAQACGIAFEPCRLYEAAGRAHFMTRRFDRDPAGNKLHAQTLCALAGLDFNVHDAYDYNQAFMAACDLGLDYRALDELFRRMVFNVALANNDDHTKNLSFLMNPQGVWSLAPAYDLTHAYNPNGLWTNRHQMAVNGKYSHITRADLLEVAQRFHITSPEDSLDSMLAVANRWPHYAELAAVPEQTVLRITEDIKGCTQPLQSQRKPGAEVR
ncbi:MAG: type II toxin-antitoxin system HipA family toxin [Coriobacteriia bacterium]|nr:type II toxin-antitoxin system HipA family toxin [Coriobacteriia bacterium]